MSEELFYAVANIANSLSIFNQNSNWETLINWIEMKDEFYNKFEGAYKYRIRYDQETKLIIEEIDKGLSYKAWKVHKVHQDVKNKSQAVLLAASSSARTLAEQQISKENEQIINQEDNLEQIQF